jgi:hypothetical protein
VDEHEGGDEISVGKHVVSMEVIMHGSFDGSLAHYTWYVEVDDSSVICQILLQALLYLVFLNLRANHHERRLRERLFELDIPFLSLGSLVLSAAELHR